jgi:hypothetical protein
VRLHIEGLFQWRPVWSGQHRQVFDHFFVTFQAVANAIGIGIGPLPLLSANIATRFDNGDIARRRLNRAPASIKNDHARRAEAGAIR